MTVQFEFTGVPKAKRRRWIVNHRGSVDLCPTDPGFPVDVYITTDIRTMVHVWVGKLALDKAISSELMEVIGPRQLRERLKAWFLYSPINMNGHCIPHRVHPRNASSMLFNQSRSAKPAGTITSSPSPADFRTPTAARSNLHSARQPSYPTSRAFLHWRLSDDGPGASRIVPDGRHPKPFTAAAVRAPRTIRAGRRLVACGGQPSAEPRGIGGRFASALASPPCYFALAVGIELLVGQHADQDDGSHHREVE